MQLFKSFAYIKDKTSDKKKTSAEVNMTGENVDEDDLMNALQFAGSLAVLSWSTSTSTYEDVYLKNPAAKGGCLAERRRGRWARDRPQAEGQRKEEGTQTQKGEDVAREGRCCS